MRSAETVLGIIRERGRQKLPLEDVYRQLFNPNLYLTAYGRISGNAGALTPGTTGETVDGMSLEKIGSIITGLRFERYRWTPVRRVYVEKKHSTRKRPLGIPTWSDKLLQEVIRLILEAYYDPQFSPASHGFRPQRGCHTALQEIQHRWTGTKWLVEGDISRCFDALDHGVMLSILREHIRDNRFLRLIENLLKTGYLEDWIYHTTLSGSPQGAGVSPILSNLYLSKLDQFVETELMPKYNRGHQRRPHRPWQRLQAESQRLRKAGRHAEAQAIRKQMQQVPALDPADPNYRRLRYLRYCDDWLLGLSGPRSEAEAIKSELGRFLKERLKLDLSAPKTLITHARTGKARFLGYDITVLHNNHKHDRRGHRSINGQIAVQVPWDLIRSKSQRYMRHGQPAARCELLHDSVFSIVTQYQQEFRGIVEYYRLALNLYQLNRLKWVMERSLVHTLAQKLRVSVRDIYRRFQAFIPTDQGPRIGLQVTIERSDGRKPLIARWGGISLARNPKAVLNDTPLVVCGPRTELEQRLLAQQCELCGSQEQIQVHHVRKLKDLHRPGRAKPPFWKQVMAARRRKTLVVCRTCHAAIHAGRMPGQTSVTNTKTLESQVLGNA